MSTPGSAGLLGLAGISSGGLFLPAKRPLENNSTTNSKNGGNKTTNHGLTSLRVFPSASALQNARFAVPPGNANSFIRKGAVAGYTGSQRQTQSQSQTTPAIIKTTTSTSSFSSGLGGLGGGLTHQYVDTTASASSSHFAHGLGAGNYTMPISASSSSAASSTGFAWEGGSIGGGGEGRRKNMNMIPSSFSAYSVAETPYTHSTASTSSTTSATSTTTTTTHSLLNTASSDAFLARLGAASKSNEMQVNAYVRSRIAVNAELDAITSTLSDLKMGDFTTTSRDGGGKPSKVNAHDVSTLLSVLSEPQHKKQQQQLHHSRAVGVPVSVAAAPSSSTSSSTPSFSTSSSLSALTSLSGLTAFAISSSKATLNHLPHVQLERPPPPPPPPPHLLLEPLVSSLEQEATNVLAGRPRDYKPPVLKPRELLPLPSLSSYTREEINKALDGIQGAGSEGQILIKACNIDFTRRDMRFLQKTAWLNDEVVNMWIAMLDAWMKGTQQQQQQQQKGVGTTIQEAVAPLVPPLPLAYIPSSFFLHTLLQDGRGYAYERVARWTTRAKIDIFACEHIIIPRNIHNSHWTCVYVHMTNKTITHIDSLGGDGEDVCNAVLRWIGDEYRTKKANSASSSSGGNGGNGLTMFQPSEWTIHGRPPTSLPRQGNGYDCGVFLCANAYFLVQGVVPTLSHFTQADMPDFRTTIGAAILSQRVC